MWRIASKQINGGRDICLEIARLHVWYPRKLPLLAISRFGVMRGFEIVDLIFFRTRMQYEYF